MEVWAPCCQYLSTSYTHTHTRRHKQTNRGWQILDMNICNMTCARGEQSARVCLWAWEKTYPWLPIYRMTERDYADCGLRNTIRVICVMRLHTLHYVDYLKPQFTFCQTATVRLREACVHSHSMQSTSAYSFCFVCSSLGITEHLDSMLH